MNIQREIKFRAKTLNGELIYFTLYEINASYRKDNVFYVGNIPCQIGSEQQFAGLKDKNRKEIYEGDLVGRRKEHLYEVKFLRGGFKLCFLGTNNEIANQLLLEMWSDKDLKIFGNIYENPELLKEL